MVGDGLFPPLVTEDSEHFLLRVTSYGRRMNMTPKYKARLEEKRLLKRMKREEKKGTPLVPLEGAAAVRFMRSIKSVPATPGTIAHEYLSGRRNPLLLTEDPDLLAVFDDKHPDGGLGYVFTDHSSVCFKPKDTAVN